jgi:hypothetical protein
VLTAGDGVWVVQIPSAAPSSSPWPAFRIAPGTSEDLLAVGDIDRDGLVDIVASDAKDGTLIRWYRNPGTPEGNWARHDVGHVTDWGDRAELADIDGDGRLDIVVSTENAKPGGASTYWFQAPAELVTQPWTRHTVAVQGSTNSLDVGDVDGDGRLAIVTGEHKGKLRVRIWRTSDAGRSWQDSVVDSGTESHLGARLVDLDGDGAPEIVGIAWDAFADLHVWRNDTRLAESAASNAASSSRVR